MDLDKDPDQAVRVVVVEVGRGGGRLSKLRRRGVHVVSGVIAHGGC